MTPNILIGCTLSPSDYRARLATLGALSREALRHVERRGATFHLRYAPDAAGRVHALVEQERRCCAFLAFEVEETADEVRVRVTVPAAAEAVPDLLFELTGGHR